MSTINDNPGENPIPRNEHSSDAPVNESEKLAQKEAYEDAPKIQENGNANGSKPGEQASSSEKSKKEKPASREIDSVTFQTVSGNKIRAEGNVIINNKAIHGAQNARDEEFMNRTWEFLDFILVKEEVKINYPLEISGSDEHMILSSLVSNRMVLIDGFHSDTLEYATSCIATAEQFSDCGKKVLHLDDLPSNQQFFELFKIFSVLKTESHDHILFVYLGAKDASTEALNELININTVAHFTQLKQIAEENGYFYVFITSEASHIQKMPLNSRLRINRIHLPFFPNILNEKFSPEKTSLLIEEINHMLELEYWEHKEGIGFYNKLISVIEAGKLYEEIQLSKAWLDKSYAEREAIIRQRREELSPARIIELDEPLILYVLFSAVFFENLATNEFEQFLEMLIEGESYLVLETDNNQEGGIITGAAPNQAAAINLAVPAVEIKKVELPDIKTEKQKNLSDRWHEKKNEVFKMAKLRVQYNDDWEKERIDFEEPDFRKRCKDYMDAHYPMFVKEQFNKLFFRKVLLFRTHEDNHIFKCLIQLAAEFAGKNPDLYCSSLLHIFTNIITDVDVQWENNAEMTTEQLNLFVAEIIRLKEKTDGFLKKLSRLIIAMMEVPKLQARVKRFFDELFYNGNYYEYMQLLSYIPVSTEFDTIEKLRPLLNNAPFEIKVQALEIIVKRVIKDGPAYVYDHLTKIWGWVTKQETLLSEDTYYAFAFFVNFLSLTRQWLPYRDYGKWPGSFILFNTLDNEDEHPQKLDLIFKWMTHSEFSAACNHVNGKANEASLEFKTDIPLAARNYNIWLSLILEDLHMILNGVEKKNENPEAIKLITILLDKINEHVPMPLRRTIRNNYAQWRTDLLNEMDKVKNDPAKYKFMFARRMHLKTLIDTIKKD
jgi:hypothetical protein